MTILKEAPGVPVELAGFASYKDRYILRIGGTVIKHEVQERHHNQSSGVRHPN